MKIGSSFIQSMQRWGGFTPGKKIEKNLFGGSTAYLEASGRQQSRNGFSVVEFMKSVVNWLSANTLCKSSKRQEHEQKWLRLNLRTNLETLKTLQQSIPENEEMESVLAEINDSIKKCQTAIKSPDMNVIKEAFKESDASIQAIQGDPQVEKNTQKKSELRQRLNDEIKRLQHLNLSIPQEEEGTETKLESINQAITKCQLALKSGNIEAMEEVMQESLQIK